MLPCTVHIFKEPVYVTWVTGVHVKKHHSAKLLEIYWIDDHCPMFHWGDSTETWAWSSISGCGVNTDHDMGSHTLEYYWRLNDDFADEWAYPVWTHFKDLLPPEQVEKIRAVLSIRNL